jgi:hypothetical protein
MIATRDRSAQLALDEIEVALTRTEQLENPASLACGAVLALAYVLCISTEAWLIPFILGYCLPRLCFAARFVKLESQRRELIHGAQAELPAARVRVRDDETS